jgi:26S proteasome regulatory subunit N3
LLDEFSKLLFIRKGKIKAVQLEYVEAFSRIMQAIRKSPENTALGFRIQAQKLATVVELLLVREIRIRPPFSDLVI